MFKSGKVSMSDVERSMFDVRCSDFPILRQLPGHLTWYDPWGHNGALNPDFSREFGNLVSADEIVRPIIQVSIAVSMFMGRIGRKMKGLIPKPG